jgi:ACS family glucarate transporter-like MFS transporter
VASLTSRRPFLFIFLLAWVSLVGYLVRSDISVAQEYLVPDLRITLNDVGTITALGFQLAYAVFQIPAGVIGDRFGARTVLGLALIMWGLGSLGSALAPAGAAFGVLFGARFLLGMGQAATYPVGCMAVSEVMPPRLRATANAVFIAAANLGAALAPLLLAPIMVALGWRAVFLTSAGLGLLTAGLWFAATPAPAQVAAGAVSTVGIRLRESVALFRDRNLALLSLGYALHSAVFFVFIFWFFRYLTEGRGFSVLASGVWGSIPTLTAFFLAPLGGVLADRLGRLETAQRTRARVAVGCELVAAVLVVIGALAPGPILAIAALSLSVAAIASAEGPLWAVATSLKPGCAGAAGGVLNFMGNVGGIASIWLVPRMKDAWGWSAMLAFWAFVALLAAGLWSRIQSERS